MEVCFLKNYILILVLVLVCLSIVNFQADAKYDFKLEYLGDINISSSYFPVGKLPLPVICENMVYDSVESTYDNYHNIYDIENRELLKSYKLPPSIDSLGLYTNGKQVVYVHEMDKKAIVYEGLNKIWEEEFDDYIFGLTMDQDYIYAAVAETGIVILEMDGKRVNIINGEMGEYIAEKKYAIGMLNDEKNLYLFDRKTLYKIDKDTYETEYRVKYNEGSFKIVLQNSKFLFRYDANMIDKETGEVVDRIEGWDFAVDEDLIIYTDGKLIAKNIDTGEKLWEKEFIENRTFVPLIDNGYFYIFLEKFYVIDVRTGNVVWEDEPIDYFFEYVPQIMATDEYVTVFIENRDSPKLRIYRKVFE